MEWYLLHGERSFDDGNGEGLNRAITSGLWEFEYVVWDDEYVDSCFKIKLSPKALELIKGNINET